MKVARPVWGGAVGKGLSRKHLAGRLLYRNRVIVFEEIFRGTLNAAAVYPREIVKRALVHNAVSVILVHNHPSNCAEPSESDKAITWRIRDALNLPDIQTLDHVIVGADACVSLAECGVI